MNDIKESGLAKINNIIFICGALRSGSTLFHLMLNSHPNIINPGEYDFLFDKITSNGGFPEIEKYREYLLSDRIFNSKFLEVDESLEYSDLIKSFIEQMKDGNKILAINIHRNFEHAYKMFPDARFIHLLRDPRDVASSSIGMNWAGNVYYGVDHWIETEKSWEKLLPLLKKKQHIEVRFEKLISDSVIVLNTVCDFIGTTYTNAMFDYQNNSTYSKPDITLINQWKKKLSIQELQNVEFKAFDMMSLRNYELSGSIIPPTMIRRVKLSSQNYLYKIRKGIERYGFVLFVLYRLTSRFGLKSWNTSLHYKVSNINTKHLK
ncbi:MAG: sulfotransferase [Candidatus Marithrix sp.]